MRKELIETIARTCHEANKAFCELHGDYSQVSWEQAPSDIKKSAINGVEFHLSGDRDPSESHINWMRFKVAKGWSWGLVKDAKRKLHPCMVPYSDLPKEQRFKDSLFKAICDVYKREHTPA